MNPRESIVSLDACVARVRADQAAGRRVVLCLGCFDLVHPGHVRHLQQARAAGDRLVVAVSADRIVGGKGTGRPLIPEELRAENLAALDCVDLVVVNPHPTGVELLERLRPDVYVKGREYAGNRDPRFAAEQRVVERHGGRVVFTSGEVVFSSSALIDAVAGGDGGHRDLRGVLDQPGCDPAALERIVAGMRGRTAVVVGETVIDTYVSCDRPVVAGEAPIMTLRPIERRRFDGGAAVVARHLAALGARPILLTPLPPGPESESLCLRLEIEGVETRPIPCTGTVPEKQRFLVGDQKVMKLDPEQGLLIDEQARRRIVDDAVQAALGVDAAIVCDFGLGLFAGPMMESLTGRLAGCATFTAGDVSGRRSHLGAIRGLDLVAPSEVEIRDALHDYDDGLTAVADRLLSRTAAASAIVTLGGDGLVAFERQARPHAVAASEFDAAGHFAPRLRATPIPALAPRAVDPLGCGDSLLAAATLARAGGAPMPAAALLGAIAAAAQASRLGNVAIGASDLRAGIQRLAASQVRLARPGSGRMNHLPGPAPHDPALAPAPVTSLSGRSATPAVALVIPTRDRPGRLLATLDRIDRTLSTPEARAVAAPERCEIVVVDDAARRRPVPRLPRRLPGGTRIRFGRRAVPAGAAARNDGASMTDAPWLLMLDDDSWPEDVHFLELAAGAARDTAVIGLDIRLAGGRREAGGLPEIHVGCGALVRTRPFRALGGYDADFHYYVEESDLCARLIAGGWRIGHDLRSRVTHAKVTTGRDMNTILERLVRNNGWLLARYAPEPCLATHRRRMIDRYAAIAEREAATAGFARGIADLERTEADQRRRPLGPAAWDRFVGRAAVRLALRSLSVARGPRLWASAGFGKGLDVLREEAAAEGWREVERDRADVVLPGSLSPGPMLDAADALRLAGLPGALPWTPRGRGEAGAPGPGRPAVARLAD